MEEENGLEMDWEMAHVPFFDRFKFRNIRRWKGITQKEFALLIGNSPNDRLTVNKWENGVVIPRLSTINKMAKAFGVRPSDLMSTHQELQKSEEVYKQAMKARGYLQTDATLNNSRKNVIKRQTQKKMRERWDKIQEESDEAWHASIEEALVEEGRAERMAQFLQFSEDNGGSPEDTPFDKMYYSNEGESDSDS